MQDDSGSNLSYRLFSNGYAALYDRSWSWDIFGGVQFQYEFTGWATYQLHSNWSVGGQFGIGPGGAPEASVGGMIGGGVTFEPISGDPPASGP
jgi:hypothetical protein